MKNIHGYEGGGGLEVIHEAEIKQDTIDLASTQKMILDACKCTGNCEE